MAGAVDFAGSDAALKDEELAGAEKRCGGADNLIELPAYVSPIAVIYNLDGVDNLQLSPATVAGIFLGKITKWNDAAIAADNPDATLPDTAIVPVHRSDESGTTENFTDYLNKTAGDVWTAEASGEWPTKGGEAADGTSGVVAAVKNGTGTIGYADASQAGELGKARSRSARTSSSRAPRLPPRSSRSPSAPRVPRRTSGPTSSTARPTPRAPTRWS